MLRDAMTGENISLDQVCSRELDLMMDLLNLYANTNRIGKTVRDFPIDQEDLHLCINFNNGEVFFSNKEFQVAKINPETSKIEEFYSTPGKGIEGFKQELLDYLEENKDSIHPDDAEFIKELE